MRALLAALLCLVLAAPAHAASLPRTPDAYPWTVDGSVLTMARSGDAVYLGGDFTYLGPRNGPLALLDDAGAPVDGFPALDNGFVNVVAADGAGGWYAGGYFTGIGGEDVTHLAHVNADGTVDTGFAPELDGEVVALAVAGGRVYIAGSFSHAGGAERSGLAAVSPAGAVLGWNPAPQGSPRALAAAGGKLYVGGEFSVIARSGLAAFDAATGALSGWSPALDEPRVRALAASATGLYVSGAFTAVGGPPRSHLAAFAVAGDSLVEGWAPPAQADFGRLVYSPGNDTLYLSGSNVEMEPGNFAPLHARDGTNGARLGSPYTLGPTEVAVDDSTLYVAAMHHVPGTMFEYHYGVVGYALDDLSVERFRVPMIGRASDAGVRALAVAGGKLLAGGSFPSIGGSTRNRLAAVDLLTGEATDWNPGADGAVPVRSAWAAPFRAGIRTSRAGRSTRS
jgi:hypothetical protein